MTATDPRQRRRPPNLLALSVIALVVGLITGLGAVFFRGLIAVVHNLTFFGVFSFDYDANVFTPQSPWGVFVILVPVVGGLIVTFLVTNFAPEARGHGVPEVMDAIYYKGGAIRPVVAAIKSLASALSIGTGAAVGREGPIIQIGASLGSSMGQVLKLDPWQRITLVAAGAGAGIAATFNTPIGGVLFAIELMMPEVSVRTFLPVALATGTATFIGRLFFGLQPAFTLPTPSDLSALPVSVWELLLAVVLGAVIGVAATAFIRGLHWCEEVFQGIGNSYLRHAVGMALVGTLMYGLDLGFGQYFVDGVGYATIENILNGTLIVGGLLALLFFCKLAATAISLGSGASGGIFSPSLFMGATLGGGFGELAHLVLPAGQIGIAGYAIIGMAAMVGGATGAAMTAVTMIFEMTRDYNLVMPMIVAVAISIGIRRVLSRENIYTIKLVARGHFIPKSLHANLFLVRTAKEVMAKDVVVAAADSYLGGLLPVSQTGDGMRHVVVAHDGRIVGVQRINAELRQGLDENAGAKVGDVARRNFTIARESDILVNVIDRMWQHKATMAVVVRAAHRIPRSEDVVGIISKEHIADSVAAGVQSYRD
jgi:CIC family chloride channel protein